MSQINLSDTEKAALSKIDDKELDRAIEQAMSERSSSALYQFRLSDCGPYVDKEYRRFGEALSKYNLAKSSRKVEETYDRLRKAAWDLDFAVGQMKHRLAEEEKDGELFYVYDDILPMYNPSKSMSVTVRYRWRKNPADSWSHGHITFHHEYEERPQYGLPTSQRKLSAAKQREQLEEKLYVEWDFLVRYALYAVRDYFREGLDGADIPEKYRVTIDSYNRTLNNYSAVFWGDKA
ncbi:hypothetical protein MKK50_15225 [Methylobacterium sp. J-043]|nr:hypothetical protein [Methylobacterium sp. J-043]